MKRNVLNKIGTYILLFLVTGVILFPIYWMILASFRESKLASTSLIPDIQNFNLSAYIQVFHDFPFLTWFRNSVIVAVLTTIVALTLSVLAAYALSRFQFRGKFIFSVGIILTQLLPGVLIAIPLYTVLSRIGLLNNYFGLTLAYVTRALPFSMWMLWGYFNSIPPDLEEAAMVDGASRIQALIRIILPLSAPGLMATMLFTFVLAWEEFLYALLIMSSDRMITLTVGAARLAGNMSILWGELMAYSVMMTIPTGIFFIFLQKYLVQGLTAGAVKA